MKKNKMMRLASVLLVLTLLSTSVISGTFAKYVTEGSAGDSARVAKWGVVVDASGSLFGEKYYKYVQADTTNSNKISLSVEDSVTSAVSQNAVNNISNIVAPGTKNDTGITFAVSGTPEVDYAVDGTFSYEDIWLAAGKYGVLVKTNKVTESNYVGYYYKTSTGYALATAGDTFADITGDWYTLRDKASTNAEYRPLVWYRDSTLMGPLNQAAFDMYIKDTFDYTKEAGVSANKSLTLTWEWPFDSTKSGHINDGADTILGNLMAAGDNYVVVKTSDDYATCTELVDQNDYNLEVAINATITVTQVD